MTIERTLIVGFDDLKAVAFQRKNCGARVSIQAKSLRDAPLACVSCNAGWRTAGAGQGMTAKSAATGLIEAIVKPAGSDSGEPRPIQGASGVRGA